MIKTTLCYIEKNDKYLMLHRNKKSKDPNKEKWIGVGGKIEENETIEDCLLREVLEETGLKLLKYNYRGEIHFHSDIYEDEIMYLYTANEFLGEIGTCDEGELIWVNKSEIFNLNLWEGDKNFLRKLIEDDYNPFVMELYYKGDELVQVK